ncbi:hypothetical protein U9M48_031297, partial [Paspalum notatum var. saurae]
METKRFTFLGRHLAGLNTLKSPISILYNIVRSKTTWNNLLPRIANLTLLQEPDSFHWNLTQNGVFSVKSHYQALIRVEGPNFNFNENIWRIKAPVKVKIFLWYLRTGILLTEDNLTKRNCVLPFSVRQPCVGLYGYVIFAAVHYVRTWAILQRSDTEDLALIWRHR